MQPWRSLLCSKDKSFPTALIYPGKDYKLVKIASRITLGLYDGIFSETATYSVIRDRACQACCILLRLAVLYRKALCVQNTRGHNNV
jgi:hypothetical protein